MSFKLVHNGSSFSNPSFKNPNWVGTTAKTKVGIKSEKDFIKLWL
ncbi:MAG: hypothetical protein WEC59_04310 [Salibacteraceae bacterium]